MTHPQDLDRRFLLGGLTGAAGVAALAHLAKAGPLTPPAGAVTGTAKPLGEIMPRTAINSTNTPGDSTSLYKILLPGSYYLTGNITGVSGKSGILIASANVTIDLCGFSLSGIPGSLNGITTAAGSLAGIMIHGGTVSGWGSAGIDISSARQAIIERIVASSNGSAGLNTGGYAVIRNCIANLNGTYGIAGGANTLVESCVASDSVGTGISVGSNSIIRACTSRSSGSTGFVLGTRGLITDSAAYENGAGGIVAAAFSVVRGCFLESNSNGGISAGTRCLISNNYCHGSIHDTGSGISVSGAWCQVIGNTCSSNGTGISIANIVSLVIRNTCSDSNTTNWSIAFGNRTGQIVDITAGGAAAVVGDAASSTLTTTDPHANFTL